MVESVTKGIEAPRMGRFTRTARRVLRERDNGIILNPIAAHCHAADLPRLPTRHSWTALIGTLGIKNRLASRPRLVRPRLNFATRFLKAFGLAQRRAIRIMGRLQCLSEILDERGRLAKKMWHHPDNFGVIRHD